MKLLVLQQWYGLSKIELEKQTADRIYLPALPQLAKPTARLLDSGAVHEAPRHHHDGRRHLRELQRQVDEAGSRVWRGMAQDASIVEVAPGHSSSKPRNEKAATRRSSDDDRAKRSKGSIFGYKLHVKTDLEHWFVRTGEATAASIHDSRVDLSQPSEVVYQDKGYFWVELRCWDAIMRRGVRGPPLGESDILRNRKIGTMRRPMERVFAVVKRIFHSGRVLVATLPRVSVKIIFACLCFNMLQLV